MFDPDSDRPYARKFRRAMKHLDEIKAELVGYESDHPCIPIRDRKTNPNPRIWSYRAKLSKQPSPDLSLMIGDFVHNLRAALDHVAACLAPASRKRKAKFPIVQENIWRTDPETGEELERFKDALRSFRSAIKGMPDDAKTFIEMCQPYHADRVRHQPLAVLHSLDQADKHYELTTVATGIERPVTTLETTGDFRFRLTQPKPGESIDQIIEDGGIVARFPITPRYLKAQLPDVEQWIIDLMLDALADGNAEVNVKITGTPRVAFKVAGNPMYGNMPGALEEILAFVKEILTTLDQLVEALDPRPAT